MGHPRQRHRANRRRRHRPTRRQHPRTSAATAARPEILDGNQLQPPATATTIRTHKGHLTHTTGPHTASAEPLGGYYLIEATDIDHAITIAAHIPALHMGGAVEIRPVIDR
jgi:hypothetical protein